MAGCVLPPVSHQ